MKVFIVGMPSSGKTTVSKALCQQEDFRYIDACSWFKSNFRSIKEGEHIEQYHDAYHDWLLNRIKKNPSIVMDNINSCISVYSDDPKFLVIDGISSPKDFISLFDVNQDFVVFLNRTDNQEVQVKDYEMIGISVIRDYCFWLSAATLLNRERWLEYNFKMINGTERFKTMGSKNSVFILGSLDKVIEHLKEALLNILNQNQSENLSQ